MVKPPPSVVASYTARRGERRDDGNDVTATLGLHPAETAQRLGCGGLSEATSGQSVSISTTSSLVQPVSFGSQSRFLDVVAGMPVIELLALPAGAIQAGSAFRVCLFRVFLSSWSIRVPPPQIRVRAPRFLGIVLALAPRALWPDDAHHPAPGHPGLSRAHGHFGEGQSRGDPGSGRRCRGMALVSPGSNCRAEGFPWRRRSRTCTCPRGWGS